MANTIKAEMWDRMQFLFRNYYDRMVHAKFVYEGDFDMSALKNAVLFMVEKAPVLHSSFVTTVVEPFWKEEKYTVSDIVSYEEVQDADKESDEWLLGVIPYTENVQIKIAVFKDQRHSVLWRARQPYVYGRRRSEVFHHYALRKLCPRQTRRNMTNCISRADREVSIRSIPNSKAKI